MKRFKIVWSPLAEEKYFEILVFLIENWSVSIAKEFESKVDSLLFRLSVHQNLCPASKIHKNLRRCVITPQTSLIYRIRDGNVIEIVAFFDNRSNYSY